MQIKSFGVVRDSHDLFDPRPRLAKVRQHITYRIVPGRVLPLATSRAFFHDVIRDFATRTSLLQAYQNRHVHRSLFGVHVRRILRRLEIIIDVHNSVAGRHFVLQRSHVAEMTDLHVLFAGRAVTFATLVSLFSRDRTVAGPAHLPRLAVGLHFSASRLVVFETCHTPEVSVAVCAGDSVS
jgi:hypothetical protein